MKSNHKTSLFISHGGGPLPLLGDPGHVALVEKLKSIANNIIQKPSSILLISAHWEETIPTITSGANPELIYDYFGFPEDSYKIKYPCKGEPALAKKVQQCLESAGIVSKLDSKRGFDHGLFVPLKIMYPDADIPCIQLSLMNNLDPKSHLNMGKALRQLDHPNLLMIGSGFSFHNMKAFFKQYNFKPDAENSAFEHWLIDTLSSPNIKEEIREQKLIDWSNAPSARVCHPREEHLLPLHVCYGANQIQCSEYFRLTIMDMQASMYLWK